MRVPVSGQVSGEEERDALIRVARSGRFAPGECVEQFEEEFAHFVGKRYALFVNSGSSANLLAAAAYKANRRGECLKAVLPAVVFPTTINPYLQLDYDVRVIDVTLDTLQACWPVEFGVHTLGNYADISGIEDSCDAMMPGHYKADIQTFSFFPAHYMSTGEGGMCTTDNAELFRLMRSLRDWGRDCWCKPGMDDTCGKRFRQQFGDMPYGYDHKYIYSHIGYNLNGTEMAAAIGVQQLRKLPGFLDIRRRHYSTIQRGLAGYGSVLVPPRSVLPDTPWFGYPVIIRPGAAISRADMLDHLSVAGVGTRMIMAGNILRQPGYKDTPIIQQHALTNADIITENAFYIGCWHGLTDEQVEYEVEAIRDFLG